MTSVLFVEDESVMRAAFQKMMDWDASGFVLASTVANGAEAIAYIDANPVDIVVTDLKMPVMGGIELIEALKAMSFNGVILVLSNYTDFELVRIALTRGASDYMLKINIDGETLRKQLTAAAAILESKALAKSDSSDGIPPEYDQYQKEVREVMQFIHTHYSEKITLDDVAGVVNMSNAHLCRLFKRQTGNNIFEYINVLRMKKAASLIEAGETYMREVASTVGIDDQFYFTRLFRKHFGMPPSEYRKTFSAKENAV